MAVVRTHLWHLWPGRHWPLTHAEEAAFAAELAALTSGRRPKATRGDITAVLNALRCGLSVQELLLVAGGLKPNRLLVAYQELDRRLQSSAASWAAIVNHPTIATLTEHAPNAARLLPVPVHRILSAAAYAPAHLLRDDISHAAAEVAKVGAAALALEQRLPRLDPDHAIEAALGLYHPYFPGLWGHPYFMPNRVGTLVPTRVRELLGEHR